MSDTFLSVGELEDTDAFKKLTYQDQMQVRSEWARTYLPITPGFNALDATQQQTLAHDIITSRPVFKDQESEDVKWAIDVGERVRLGDVGAKEEAKRRVLVTESGRTSIVGNIVAGVTSVVEGGASYDSLYGGDGQKINAYLMQQISQAPTVTAQELQDFKTQIAASSMAINMVEGIITSVGLVGSIGKAGLLTKGIMGPGGRIAKYAATMKHGLAQGIVSEFGEQAVQSVMMGVFSTAQNAAVMKLQTPDQRQSVADAAKYLGSELLFDWVAWAALTPALTSGKAILKSFTGFDAEGKALRELIASEGVDNFRARVYSVASGADFDEAQMQSLKAASPSTYDAVLRQHNAARAANMAVRDGLDTPDKRAIAAAYTAGYSYEKNADGLIELRKLEEPLTPVVFGNPDEAIKYAVANSSIDATPVGIGQANDLEFRKGFETKLNPKTQYSAPQLRKILTPEGGRIRPENAKFFILNTVYASGAAEDIGQIVKDAKVKVDTDAFNPSKVLDDIRLKQIVLPAEINNPAMERKVRDYLYNYSKGLAAMEPNRGVVDGVRRRVDILEREIQASRLVQPGSLEGVKYISNKYLGINTKFSKFGKISIGDEIFDTPEAAYQSLYVKLLDSGKLDFEETKEIIKNVSGYTLDVKMNPDTGISMYALYRPGGGYIHRDTSLSRLIEGSPEIGSALTKMKFPGQLAPSTWIIDANTGSARVNGDVVVGSLNSISEFANNFFDIKRTRAGGTKLVDTLDDKAVALDVNRALYTVTDPDSGLSWEFDNAADAKDFIKTEIKSWDNIKREFDRRGYYTARGPKGVVQAFDMDGKQVDISSIEQANDFFKSHPIPGSNASIFGGDPEVEANVFAENKLAVEKNVHVGKMRNAFNNFIRSETFSQILLPTESHFEDVARKSGDPTFLKAWRGLEASMRVVNAKNTQYGAIIDSIWKEVPRKDFQMISELLDMPDQDWPAILSRYNRELTPRLSDVLNKTRAYYEEINKSLGIANGKNLSAYAPRIKDHIKSLLAKNQEPPTNTKELLKGVFGDQVPPELSFFAETVRRDVFMDALTDRNPYRAMQVYTNQMNKKAFLGSQLEVISKLLGDAADPANAGKYDKTTAKYFRDSVLEMMGHKTVMSERLQKFSRDTTVAVYDKLVKNLGKTKAFKDVDLASYVITDDLIGKLSSYFTISTQAARAWAIPRNLTQTSLLGAIIGNKRAWDSFAYTVDHPEFINKLIKKGLFSESLYHGHDLRTSPTRNLIEWSLNPLENSDMITRGAAYRAAEVGIDEALPRYRRGLIDKTQFIDEIQADILDPDLQAQLLTMVDTGNIDGAKDLMGQKLIDMTMFNYGKGMQGTVFRGAAGRLFGKLGVYPMGALSLYRDILSRGNGARAAARAGRLIATTSAIYWAFNSVGIDYQGFLWTDPFEFSGGPYWVMLNDLLESFGSGQDSAMAKARLKNSVARTAVPYVFRYMVDAARFASEGRPVEALLSLSTAPMKKALKENGDFTGTIYDM